jgi:hypothetical protein
VLPPHDLPLNPNLIKEKITMRISASIFHSPVFKSYWAALALLFVLSFVSRAAQAQSLGYEGPTGVFVTPLAYTSASPVNGLGKPSVSYHFLAGGPVIGDFSTVSITEGFAKRFELGYTSEIHAGAFKLPLQGYSGSQIKPADIGIVHGKATLVAENAGKTKWVPAIAVGGIYRFHDNYVYDGASLSSGGTQSTSNGDIYVVATKTVTQISKKVPVLLSGGLRGTDASLWGLGGNAPGFSARGFGALALVFTGPGKSAIILASEVSQQPQKIKLGLSSGLDVPTSEVYAVRVVPSPNHKFNLDAGILHAGGGIGGNARARVAFGISYGF